MTTIPQVTPAQLRILEEVRAAGGEGRKYFKARREPLDRLESLGLVTVDWQPEQRTSWGGDRYTVYHALVKAT